MYQASIHDSDPNQRAPKRIENPNGEKEDFIGKGTKQDGPKEVDIRTYRRNKGDDKHGKRRRDGTIQTYIYTGINRNRVVRTQPGSHTPPSGRSCLV